MKLVREVSGQTDHSGAGLDDPYSQAVLGHIGGMEVFDVHVAVASFRPFPLLAGLSLFRLVFVPVLSRFAARSALV